MNIGESKVACLLSTSEWGSVSLTGNRGTGFMKTECIMVTLWKPIRKIHKSVAGMCPALFNLGATPDEQRQFYKLTELGRIKEDAVRSEVKITSDWASHRWQTSLYGPEFCQCQEWTWKHSTYFASHTGHSLSTLTSSLWDCVQKVSVKHTVFELLTLENIETTATSHFRLVSSQQFVIQSKKITHFDEDVAFI